mmetsp:Transcript_2542/g.9167  ORF Transcript_2542/g.9167 Transcript_2542/m.9167 type:complete len:294 (-) Transcript_2542:613-1494(-)
MVPALHPVDRKPAGPGRDAPEQPGGRADGSRLLKRRKLGRRWHRRLRCVLHDNAAPRVDARRGNRDEQPPPRRRGGERQRAGGHLGVALQGPVHQAAAPEPRFVELALARRRVARVLAQRAGAGLRLAGRVGEPAWRRARALRGRGRRTPAQPQAESGEPCSPSRGVQRGQHRHGHRQERGAARAREDRRGLAGVPLLVPRRGQAGDERDRVGHREQAQRRHGRGGHRPTRHRGEVEPSARRRVGQYRDSVGVGGAGADPGAARPTAARPWRARCAGERWQPATAAAAVARAA